MEVIMSWEWSHTNEAYENGYQNLCNMSREELNTILAEWKATKHNTEYSGDPQFRANRYDKCLDWVSKLPASDIVVDTIWDKASELRSCDNGGFRLHVCPYGCHTVSCDLES
jgi:hypothetical protein